MEYLQVTILRFHLITAADIGMVALPSGTISPVTEGGDFMVTLTLSLFGLTLEVSITVIVSTAPITAVDSGMSHNIMCNCPLGISYHLYLFCPQAQMQIS